MKIYFSIFFCLLLCSCNNAENKNTNASASSDNTTPTSLSTEEADKEDKSLTQNGTYTTLFDRERGDCNFITEEDMAIAIGIPATAKTLNKSSCTFNLTEANGNKSRFLFTVENWGLQQILKEIATAKNNAETFGKDSKLSQYRISETGDTYLSMHQNRMIRILNEVSNTAIILFYYPDITPGENNSDLINQRKDEARERAYDIANYLLKKHKK